MKKLNTVGCVTCGKACLKYTFTVHLEIIGEFNPLNAELNPICYLLALLELTIFSTLAG